MEKLDVINEKGKIIGQKDRKDIYKDGDLHRTVHIWVMNSKKELLVQKRSPKKDTYANLWAISTAGHVKSGDNNLETAIRELKEELGIEATVDDLEYLFSIRRKEDDNSSHINTIDDVYLIERDLDIENTKLQLSELTDIKFVYYEYLEQIYKDKDESYVPANEEHEKLFKYLHDRFDDHDKLDILYKSECEYNLSAHTKLTKYYYTHNPIYKALGFILLICIICDLAVVLILNDYVEVPTLIFEIIILVAISFLLPAFKCKRMFDSYKILKDKVLNYVFYEEHFTVKNKQISMKIFYDDLHEVIETSSCFYLYISCNQCYIVDKNSIDTSFSKFIKNKVGKRYKKGFRG